MTLQNEFGRRVRRVLLSGLVLALALPATALAQAGLATKTDAPATKPAELPAARDLFARHVEALGGEKAIRKLSSVHMIGTFELPAGGINADMHVYQHAPNKVLMTINIEGMGEIRRGYDGTVGWSLDPMQGPALIEGEELTQMQEEADFFREVNYDKRFKSMETIDRSDFNGRMCHVVKAMSRTDTPHTIYFDVETGLQAGEVSETQTQMGPMMATTVIEGYKAFGEMKFPTKVTTKLPDVGMEQSFTVRSIELDKIPASQFQLPDEIKALLKSEKGNATTRPAKASSPPGAGR